MIVWGSSMTTIGNEYPGGLESRAIDSGAIPEVRSNKPLQPTAFGGG